VRHAGAGFNCAYQQPQPYILLRPGQQSGQSGYRTLRFDMQGKIEGGPQRTGYHQAPEANDVERTKPYFV
jgi:hypothetical protein